MTLPTIATWTCYLDMLLGHKTYRDMLHGCAASAAKLLATAAPALMQSPAGTTPHTLYSKTPAHKQCSRAAMQPHLMR